MLAARPTLTPTRTASGVLTTRPSQPSISRPQPWPRGSGGLAVAAAAPTGGTDPAPPSTAEPADADGLLPEEDFVVPGTPNDSLTSNTALGRAVGSACEELESLAALEAEAASAAAELLLKLGYRVSKVADGPPAGGDGGGEEEAAGAGGGGGGPGAA